MSYLNTSYGSLNKKNGGAMSTAACESIDCGISSNVILDDFNNIEISLLHHILFSFRDEKGLFLSISR